MRKTTKLLTFTVGGALALLMLVGSCSQEAQQAALRANDIADCNNLMGLHVWYHSAFLNDVELEKLWVTTPENQATAVWAQNANYWIGMDNIKAYYGPAYPHENTMSQFQFHTTTSGIVEIADDRQTAKGVWYTPGIIGRYQGLQALWERYGIDFIMENGEWKIWHLHVYTDFGYGVTQGSGGGPGAPAPEPAAGPGAGGPPAGDQGAPEQAERFGPEAGGPPGGGPMAASQATADVPYRELGPDTYPDLIPRPPEPYTTFSETWSYGDPNEGKMFSGPYREWSEIKAEYGAE